MNILVCNDDGYYHKNFQILLNELKQYGNLYISAPKKEHSGASSSMTLGRQREVEIINQNTIIVDGTPVDCVLEAFKRFKDIDLVVSGINNGHNIAHDTLYSGTIGACIISSVYNIKCIALSSEDLDEDILKEKTKFVLNEVFKNKLYDNVKILNINYPFPYAKTIYELKYAKVYKLPMRYEGVEDYSSDPIDSDRYLLNKGYFTMSPLKPSLFDEERYNILKNVSD